MKISTRSSLIVLCSLAVFASGCTKNTILQTAQNQALISTSAAPVCGTTGAMRVAGEMAAVATLRQGYTRFIIGDASSDSNVQMVQIQSGSYTTGTVNTFGNTSYGNFQTSYNTMPMFIGRHNTQLLVFMFNPGEPGFDQALDAKITLGEDWEEKVINGITTCSK